MPVLDLYVSECLLSSHALGFMLRALQSGFTDDFWASSFQISNKNRLGLFIKGFPTVSAQWEGQDLNHLLGHNKQPQLKVNKCFCVICISEIVKNMFCFVFQLFSFLRGVHCAFICTEFIFLATVRYLLKHNYILRKVAMLLPCKKSPCPLQACDYPLVIGVQTKWTNRRSNQSKCGHALNDCWSYPGSLLYSCEQNSVIK